MDKNLTLEAALSKLEAIVEKLETGDITLDESIQLYQEGVLLSKHCSRKLEEAEGKIITIMNKNGELSMEELTPSALKEA
jgi:exodeoxyribonuclease VII small subunit